MHRIAGQFLAEIAAHPDDDTPRLVFADWLEEQGDARAEFIRAQCQRARLAWTAPRWWDLLDREERLLATHAKQWLAEPPRLRNVTWGWEPQSFSSRLESGTRAFQRGFVETAKVRNLQALIDADKTSSPLLLRELLLKDFGPRLIHRLRTSPWLGRLRGLYLFRKWLGRDFLEPLGQAPEAAGLRRLELEGNLVQRTGLEALCESPYLTSLETLNLGHNRLEGRDLLLLRDWPGVTRLKSLCLFGNALGDAAADFLSSPALASLHALDLGSCQGNFAMADALSRNEHLGQLTHLSLSGNQIGSVSIGRLFDRNACPALRVLDLQQSWISDDALRTIAVSPMSAQLRTLRIGQRAQQRPQITGAGVRALTESPYLGNLRRLVLDQIAIDVPTADALCESALGSLREIGMDYDSMRTAAGERLGRRFRVYVAVGA
jgi:uncharacterized protein (TIGR02996 family)